MIFWGKLQAELRRQEEEAKKLRLQGQNPDGSGGGAEGDFMSEAKDWAGELISGQTGTGRILVSFFMSHYEMFDAYYDELRMDFDTEHYVY